MGVEGCTNTYWEQDAIGVYTWALLCHAYVMMFLCVRHVSAVVLLLFVKSWLKLVEKEM